MKNAFVMKQDAKTTKKVGIEHACKETLEEALNNLITYKDVKESLTKEEYFRLGLNGLSDSSIKREKLAKHYHLGKCNSKTMYKRLNLLGVKYDELEKLLNDK